MDTIDRKNEILKVLGKNKDPVSATKLADKFSVSRQVIVGDIALLRASGKQIESTSRGYVLTEKKFGYIGIVASKHGRDEIQDELNTIVDFGGTCIDVSIEHKVYGEITGKICVSSRYDVSEFINKVKNEEPLSSLSNGIHFHRIGTINKEIFDLIKIELDKKGYLINN